MQASLADAGDGDPVGRAGTVARSFHGSEGSESDAEMLGDDLAHQGFFRVAGDLAHHVTHGGAGGAVDGAEFGVRFAGRTVHVVQLAMDNRADAVVKQAGPVVVGIDNEVLDNTINIPPGFEHRAGIAFQFVCIR